MFQHFLLVVLLPLFGLAVFGLAVFGLVRQSVVNLPKALKILIDALIIIKPLARNELSLSAVVSGYFKSKD